MKTAKKISVFKKILISLSVSINIFPPSEISSDDQRKKLDTLLPQSFKKIIYICYTFDYTSNKLSLNLSFKFRMKM